jgi:hypothetical protein
LSILDNGAFEGDVFNGVDLVDMADYYGIDEVVIPDVLGEADQTFARLRDFVDDVDSNVWMQRRFMVVVQGKTFDECRRFIDDVVALRGDYLLPGIRTFGIPKHLVETTTPKDWRVAQSIRLRLASYIRAQFGDAFDIHFLGATSWLGELTHLNPFGVRSIDTSLPYVFGLMNTPSWLGELYVSSTRRPDNYFDFVLDPEQQELAKRYVDFIDGMVTHA